MTSPASEYREAFLNGLEFALLAMEGRLARTPDVEAFLADYKAILDRYRAAEPAVRRLGPVEVLAELTPTRN